ncbi:FAS1-like dehydratase domain-containing protein [Ramlibacter sp.]|uniref:FAS1-like dehydratase domain-containing protein n=1 Tax=Ramlibacter sp. TaxID=1917967 RepID=UPI003D0B7CDB
MAADTPTTALTPDILATLKGWVGKTETLHDRITPTPMRALIASLDRDDPAPQAGTVLPPLWHWLYFLPTVPASQIGEDGHPKRGGFMPPVPLPRRMWAGGRLEWNNANPLRVGDDVQRVSSIASVNPKSGRSGEMVFVTVRHEVSNAGGIAVTEEQDIVYREAAKPGDPAPAPTAAEDGAVWQRELTPGEVLLFRYSALTFNSHRIHYDRGYAIDVEGYPGLVVHGPLIASLLADLVRRHAAKPLKKFDFKAVRPSFDGRTLRVNAKTAADGKTLSLWAQDNEGWLTMKAGAEIEE